MALPRILILNALKNTLQASVPVVDGKPKWKVRHYRNRETTFEEMPCIAIRYAGDDAPGVTTAGEGSLSMMEDAMELAVDLVVDTMVAAESDRETAGDTTDGTDPTGLEEASEIVEKSLDTIFKPGEEINTLGGLIWDARYDGSGDNDDVGTPDNVRLAERLTLVYRVRHEAPYKLLIGE